MLPRIILGLVVIIGILSMSMFRVYQHERAILFQLGQIQRSDFEPGLYFKLPFVQNVVKYDIRLQTLDSEPQLFLTGEKKDVIVDSFVRYQISDVVKYHISTGGDQRRACHVTVPRSSPTAAEAAALELGDEVRNLSLAAPRREAGRQLQPAQPAARRAPRRAYTARATHTLPIGERARRSVLATPSDNI